MPEISAKNAGTVRLGALVVNRIGLGTNRISDNDESRAVLRRAIELGVNYIDTADKYGLSEKIIGETLAPYPAGTIVSTKAGWSHNNDPQSLRSSIDNSLKLLKLDSLPHWFLHRVDTSVPIEETMRFLKDQMQAGKIKNVGLSDVSIEQIELARKIIPIASVQNRYNLEDRKHDDVVDYCTKENIVFMPFYPLGSGRSADDPKLQQIAKKYNAAPIQIALAWLLKRSPIMLPIPGTLSIEHLESNLAATNIELSDEDFKRLADI